MDYKIEKVQHSSPSLRVIQGEGQRIPFEKLKEKIEHHFGNTPQEDQKQDATPHPSAALVDKLIQEVNEMMLGRSTHFEYKIHEKSGEVIVKLIDDETDEVVKEIPSEKMVELMSNLRELIGLCLDEKI